MVTDAGKEVEALVSQTGVRLGQGQGRWIWEDGGLDAGDRDGRQEGKCRSAEGGRVA